MVLKKKIILVKYLSKRNVNISFFLCLKLTSKYHNDIILVGDNNEK